MKLVTVVELPTFLRAAKLVMTDQDRAALVDALAADPEGGVLLGGGLRKMRFARAGAGKSGGYRVVHYYSVQSGGPVFLLMVFAKNQKANLTPAETRVLVELAQDIAATYGRKQ
jgi:hypothetical protein